MLDSFATRGIKNACTQVTPGLLLTRQGDALGALSYLSNLPFVDSQRIAVVGYSQGAMVALQLASNHQAEIFDVPRDRKFKAAVAYYPLCGVASEELIVPALIMIGELDDWTPATDCERLGSIGAFGWKPAVELAARSPRVQFRPGRLDRSPEIAALAGDCRACPCTHCLSGCSDSPTI
ncbi:dienelactone hydrolase family protein [Bradyrhizobium sp.]|uniref:dienelactone hydrolase family protein n=1 Tax=Bradyrhizobium sp. TaxID=376 RepID=UPI001ED31577|nr:dienelactone hydrolase family protein [Bradyrhizobium sp.]MBV9983414.1 dienelactone hydrolase family protein [Bradyrhizobium sp.]